MSSCLQQIPVHTAPPYQVTVGPGLLRTCGPRLQEVLSPCRIAVITDSHVAPLYLERVCESLQSAGFSVVSRVVPAGEQHKTMATLAQLLEFLAERGISMAAATSSPRAHVTAALDRLGLLPYLKAVFTTGEVGVSKHEPVIYHLAAEALGTAPAETLVFEDSLYALKTAKAAGFRTVGVLDAHGETDQAGLKEAAEVYLTSLTEFPGHWEPLNK